MSKTTSENKYQNVALAALDWVAEHAWQEELGKFFDLYHVKERKFIFNVYASQNRPLLDDAVFLKGWQISGDERFRKIAFATAETLLKDENPSGNWIKYIPCNPQKGNIHPRHAYWWGKPMLDIYKVSNDIRHYELFKRALNWYQQALWSNGGLFRNTFRDFNTTSFGHTASGSACAASCFIAGWEYSGNHAYKEDLHKALTFCHSVQFRNPTDSNLRGAILEKILAPDGTDRSPYFLRDLGTIFYIQALSKALSLGLYGCD